MTTINTNEFYGIQHWAEEDRPREKLILKGRSALTNAELLAILIGTGTKNQSAVDLARSILKKVDHNLNTLAGMSLDQLTQINGIGRAKAISIISAMEIGRRRNNSTPQEAPLLNNSGSIYDYMKPHLLDLPHEEFWILLLSNACRPIKVICVSKGGLTATVVDQRMIFRFAIEKGATAMVLLHNHPSGTLRPSHQDITLTRKIQKGAELLDIKILDHIIFTNQSYYSFADENMI